MGKGLTSEISQLEMPQLPDDAFDFSAILDNHVQVAERLYKGEDFIFEPDKELVLVIIGGSGVGKDSIIDSLVDEGILERIKTATSRDRAPHEKEDTYTWMRDRKSLLERLFKQLYFRRLINKYDLVEHNSVHDNALYGTPRESILGAMRVPPRKIPVLRIDPTGARAIVQQFSEFYNFCVVGVIPSNHEEPFRRVAKLRGYEKAVARLSDSLKIYAGLPGLADYYLLNSSEPGSRGLSGLETSIDSLKKMLRWYKRDLPELD